MRPPYSAERQTSHHVRPIIEAILLLPVFKCYPTAPTTLYAASGRLIPFNSNSPTGSTFTAFSTFVSTRGLIKICPGFAS